MSLYIISGLSWCKSRKLFIVCHVEYVCFLFKLIYLPDPGFVFDDTVYTKATQSFVYVYAYLPAKMKPIHKSNIRVKFVYRTTNFDKSFCLNSRAYYRMKHKKSVTDFMNKVAANTTTHTHTHTHHAHTQRLILYSHKFVVFIVIRVLNVFVARKLLNCFKIRKLFQRNWIIEHSNHVLRNVNALL